VNPLKSLKTGLKSPKTTAGAVALLVLVVLAIVRVVLAGGIEALGAVDLETWTVLAGGVITALSLLFARDGDKRSEDVGAAPGLDPPGHGGPGN